LCQKTTSKHSGVIAFFDREYIKTGIFPRNLSKSLHQAFQRRQESDYGDITKINAEEAQSAIQDAQDFVKQIDLYITGQSKSSTSNKNFRQ